MQTLGAKPEFLCVHNSSQSHNSCHSIVDWDTIPYLNIFNFSHTRESVTERTNDSTRKGIDNKLAKGEMTA